MAFRFILPASEPYLTGPAADAGDHSPVTATRQLRHDYDRWSRLGIGVAAFALAVTGVFFGVAAIVTMFVEPTFISTPMIVFASLLLPIGVVGCYLLWRLHASGSALLTAHAAWARRPYLDGIVQRTVYGRIDSRTINYEPPIFARITTSALTFLLSVFALAIVFAPTSPGSALFVPASVTVGFVSCLTFFGQLGGVLRLVSAAAESNPAWVRLRDRVRRLFRRG